MKRAIREGHEVVRHEEFLGNVMGKCNAELLDLYLDANPAVVDRWPGGYPRSVALVRKLLARGLDPNRPDWLGRTLLHACAENGDRTIAGLFLTPAPTSTPEASSSMRRRWPRQFDTSRGAKKKIGQPWPSAGAGWLSTS